MTNLITIDNTNAVVELSTITKFSDTNEKSLRELLLKYENELFDFLPFETESSTKLKLPRKSGGVQVEWSKVKLQEEQVYFILTLLKNTENVVKFKHELIKQFFAMRDSIREIEKKNTLELTNRLVKEAVIEATKLNTYKIDGQDFISVGKYRKEIQTEHTNDFIWDALEFNKLSTSVIRPTKYRRLHEDAPDYVATTISGQSTPIFLINAIKQSITKYETYLSTLAVVEEQE